MNEHAIDLTEGSIWKVLFRYSIPLFFSNLLQQLYNTVDLMVVGNYAGETSMAAIGATGSLVFMMIGLFMGLGIGTSVIVAHAFGARDHKALFRSVHTTYAVALGSGLLLTVLGHFLTPQILVWMGTPETILQEAILYARVYFYGSIPMLIYNMGSGILRSIGDSRKPFIYLVISAVSNIALDLVFVAGFHMRALGAGIATLISQVLTAVLVTLTLMRSTEAHHLNLKEIRYYKHETRRTFVIGIPAGIQGALISFSNVLIQSQVNLYGDAAIAGVSAANRYDAFLAVGMQSFVMAATTFTGQNIGARKIERLKRGSRTAVLMGVLSSVIIGSLLLVFSRPLMQLFSSNEEVINYGLSKMRVLTPLHWIFSIAMIMAGILRGAGKSMVPMIISIFSIGIFRMIWIFVVSPFWKSIQVVFFSYPISWSMSLILTLIYYSRRKWLPEELRAEYYSETVPSVVEKEA